MARWGNCDYKQLQQLRENLEKLQSMDLDKFCRDASKELAARLLALVIPRTPVGQYPKASGKKGGTLRRGWTAKTHDEAASGGGKTGAKAYVIASALIFVGAGLSAGLLWDIADVTMGAMTLINVPVIVILGKYAFRALDDFTKQRKEGKDPTFRASDIDLPHEVDCWKD